MKYKFVILPILAALVAHHILLAFVVLITFRYGRQIWRNTRYRDTSTEPTSYGLRNLALHLSEYLIRFMALDEKHIIKYVLCAQERSRPKFHRQPKPTVYS